VALRSHELGPPKGAKHARKRVGRGNGSGHGTYSTKGLKGQKARAGKKIRPNFEGGQLPLTKRMPRLRGFKNARFRVEYEAVNLSTLARFEAGSTVSPETLRAAGIIKTARPVKILAGGELEHALTVVADKFSATAKERIEAAGGTVEVTGGAGTADE
jgi:large subunit ribosomal protein L15